MSKMKKVLNYFEAKIVNEEYRQRLTLIVLSFFFAVVSIVMCIVNIFTKQYILLTFVGIFGAISLLNGILDALNPKTHKFCEIILMVDTLLLFTYFLITGGTEGFSTYWITLLPVLGMLVFGFRKGTIYSGVMLLILIFMLWIPTGDMIRKSFGDYAYTPTNAFKTRFILVYIASYFAGAVLELIRYFTAKKLVGVSNLYKTAANVDTLTQINNQTYVADYIKNVKSHVKLGDRFGCFFMDIDNFKHFNEEYNHLIGNEVLKAIANEFKKTSQADLVARWGGDEFIMFFIGYNEDELIAIAENLRKRIEKVRIDEVPEIRITISIGIVHEQVEDNFNIDNVIYVADSRLANAKSKGKNQVAIE